MVKLFAEGGLIYEEMASHIFGLPVEEIVRLHKTKLNIIPRFRGKRNSTWLWLWDGLGSIQTEL